MTKEVKHRYCGKCIFCLSTCPKCGSKNVSVQYTPEITYGFNSLGGFTFGNEPENYISFQRDFTWIELVCADCEAEFSNRYSDEDVPELDNLSRAIDDALGIPDAVQRQDDGKIVPWQVTIKDIDKEEVPRDI